MTAGGKITSPTMSKHMFLALYGEPGIGKTRLIGGSPGKVLVIRPPVDHVDSMLPEDKQRVKEWIVRDWDDMWEAQDYLRAEGGEWDWVWLDSLSLLQDVLLDDVFAAAVERNPERKKYGVDKGEFGINMGRLGTWMRHVVGPDLFNFGWTGHTAVLPSPDLDSDGDPVEKLMPWVQGKNMSPKMCGYMNLVCFMERAGEKSRRVLRSQSDPRYYAKDQFDAFADGTLWDPTMKKVIKLIEESPGRVKQRTRSSSSGAKRTAKPRRRIKTR